MSNDFSKFKQALQRKFNEFTKYEIMFRVNVDKDKLWELYLQSFPVGTNPIYKERTEHDCQCCRHFIRTIGNLVAVVDNKLVSIWDIKVDNFYQVVTDALASYVKKHTIENVFLHTESKVGVDKNFQQLENDDVITWEHFFVQIPSTFVCKDIDTQLSMYRTTKEVLFRGLSELTQDSVETVLDLISQNSLYRGEEHKFVLTEFLKLKKQFDVLSNPEADIFCWLKSRQISISISRIRNSVIGTLLVDLSDGGKSLDDAVRAFEVKVAPTNYKRPTALITKAMIENARNKLEELGLTASLERRHAVLEDITINNVLFADRSAKKKMDSVFDELTSQVSTPIKNLNKVEEVNIETFINNIVPNAQSIEVMFENRHVPNLVSLISPNDMTAKHLFKWPNNFSWSYIGLLTDSIKEKVKLAGGKVDGDLRCSLSWNNYDDLDLWMVEPNNYYIYFNSKLSPYTGGNLDVDMNAGGGSTRSPVENICYPNRNKMKEGNYLLRVNQYCQRELTNVGFEVEIEFDGQIFSFSYPKALRTNEKVDVATIEYTHKDGFKLLNSLPSTQRVRNVWGLPTQTFHKVSVLMHSPNYWDEKTVGNKHYFFMLDGCVNEDGARGFYNEFLKEELNPHRKVFEAIGSKIQVQSSESQLSGLGFSSTQKNSLLCKVKGNFTRMINIIF